MHTILAGSLLAQTFSVERYVLRTTRKNMSFKRARAEAAAGGFAASSESLLEDSEAKEAGQRFRRLLVEKYFDGSATAADVAQLAYWHVESGGLGGEELALHPRNASKHGAEHLRSRKLQIHISPTS